MNALKFVDVEYELERAALEGAVRVIAELLPALEVEILNGWDVRVGPYMVSQTAGGQWGLYNLDSFAGGEESDPWDTFGESRGDLFAALARAAGHATLALDLGSATATQQWKAVAHG